MPEVSETGCTIWLTGLSGAGKTTTARAVHDELRVLGRTCVVIDGDDLRRGLSADLGFSAADRDENVRRAGELALLLARQGHVCVVALISPRGAARRKVRARHDEVGVHFLEVYIATPLDVCEQRDTKALYQRARAGEQFQLTGVDDPYDVPEHAEVVISTETVTPLEAARSILSALAPPVADATTSPARSPRAEREP